MKNKTNHIVIIAGEASGDMHGAHLVSEMKRLNPSLTFSGFGGAKMHHAGVEIYQDLTKIAVVGFWEVLKNYSKFKKAFDLIQKKIIETHATAVILIDYPGFNLRLAKKLKKSRIKVIYYISPQVWAWKQKRVELIKKYVDKMLVLFKFEQEFYAQKGLSVDFVGHPLIDNISIHESKETLLNSIGFKDYKFTIGLLPGSRNNEIEKLLPIMLNSTKILHKQFPMLQFLLLKSNTIDQTLIEDFTKNLNFPLKFIEGKHYEGINACDVCMVASGTATLETAILKKPMVVIYKTSFLTWILAKLFVKIPNIGLVNVVAGKKIVPECIQYKATPTLIANEIKNIFTNELRIAGIKENLQKVKDSLGEGGASKKAAETIISFLSSYLYLQ